MPRRDAAVRRKYVAPRLLRRLPPIPAKVWLIAALWASLLLGASLLWPMSYGYSEPAHIDMAYAYSADPFHFYGAGHLLPTQATVNMQQLVPGYPPKESLAGAPIPLRGERPSFAQLGGHAATHGTPPNQMVQHPPLYYWTEAVVLRVPGVSHLSWDKQVWLMRLLSVLFMLPIPILAWATATRVLSHIHPHPDATRLAVLAAVVPLTIPNLIRVGSSVTNESLLILAASVVSYLATRVMTGDLSRRTGIWMGAGLAVALLTKGSALVLPPIALAAYILGAARREDGVRADTRAFLLALVAPATGCLIGGLWWLRNLVDYGRVQIDGLGSAYERNLYGPPTNTGGVGDFVPKFLHFFTHRIWGGIGLPDSPTLTPFLVYGWFAVVMIGVLTCIFLRTGRGSQLRTLALAAAPVFTMVGLLVSSYPKYHKWPGIPPYPRASQGHYVYHLIVIVSVLAAVGWLRLLQPRAHSWLVPITLVGAILTNAAAWLYVLDSWYKPRGAPAAHGYLDTLHSLSRWSPAPKLLTEFLVCLLPVLVSIIAIIAAVRQARGVAPTAGPGGTEPDEVPPHDRVSIAAERVGR